MAGPAGIRSTQPVNTVHTQLTQGAGQAKQPGMEFVQDLVMGGKAHTAKPQPPGKSFTETMGAAFTQMRADVSKFFKPLTDRMASIEMPSLPRISLRRQEAAQPQPDLAHLAMKGGRLPNAGAATPMRDIVALQGQIDQAGDRSRTLMALREGATTLLTQALQTSNGLPAVNMQAMLQTQGQMAAAKADKGDAEAAMRTALRALPQAQLTQAVIGLGSMGPALGKELKFALDEQQARAVKPTPEGAQALQEFADTALANRDPRIKLKEPQFALTLVQIGALPDDHPVKALAVSFLASEFSLENYNFANAAHRLSTLPPGAERSAMIEQILSEFNLHPVPKGATSSAPVINLKSVELQSIHDSIRGQAGPEGDRLRGDISTDTTALNRNANAQSALTTVSTLRTQLLALATEHGSAVLTQAAADAAQIDEIKGQIAVIQLMEPGSRDAELSKLEGQLQISQLKQQLTAALPNVSAQTGPVTLADALSPEFASTLAEAQEGLQHDKAYLDAHLLALQDALGALPNAKAASQREDDIIAGICAGAESLQQLFKTDTLGRLNTAFSKVASPHIDHSAGTKVARHYEALARMPELTRGALDAFRKQPNVAPGTITLDSPIRMNSAPKNGGWEAAVGRALTQGISTLPVSEAVNIPKTIWGGQRVLPESLLAGLARHPSIPEAIGDLTYKNGLGGRSVANNTPEQRTAAALQLREFIQTALSPEQRAALKERMDFLHQLPPLLLQKSGLPNAQSTPDEAMRVYTKSVAVSGANYLGVGLADAAAMLGIHQGSDGTSAAKVANQMLSDVVVALTLHHDVVFASAQSLAQRAELVDSLTSGDDNSFMGSVA